MPRIDNTIWVPLTPSEIAALVQANNLLTNVDEGHSLLSIMTERALDHLTRAAMKLSECRNRRLEEI